MQKSTHDYQRLQTLNGIQEPEQPRCSLRRQPRLARLWSVSAAETDLSRVKNEEDDDPEAERQA
jgi:hypothetical protein